MRQTKIKEQIDIEVIDGNQLVGQVIDEKDTQVEKCVNAINDLPDSVDIKRVMAIKAQVDDGTYDFDANLSQVVDAMIDESADENPLAFPIFDR
jgi:anti-sigma28 factor (negative regulator of flagellin synthesis)